jgi:hypothetical protein
MRKLKAWQYVSLDGVVEAPRHAPKRDPQYFQVTDAHTDPRCTL